MNGESISSCYLLGGSFCGRFFGSCRNFLNCRCFRFCSGFLYNLFDRLLGDFALEGISGLLVILPTAISEACKDGKDEDPYDSLSSAGSLSCLRVYSGEFRVLDNTCQSLSKLVVDKRRGVDGPSVGIEHGTKISLADFSPCDKYRGQGDNEHESDDKNDPLPP